MKVVCRANAQRMLCECRANAVRMPSECRAKAVRRPCECRASAEKQPKEAAIWTYVFACSSAGGVLELGLCMF